MLHTARMQTDAVHQVFAGLCSNLAEKSLMRVPEICSLSPQADHQGTTHSTHITTMHKRPTSRRLSIYQPQDVCI